MSEEKNFKELGKWLWIIFWMTIAVTVISLLLDNGIATKYIPGNVLIDKIIAGVFLLTRAIIIYKLFPMQKKYQISGILGILAVVMFAVESIVFIDGKYDAWSLIVTIPALIIYVISGIMEMKAHSLVLEEVNDKMSRRWNISKNLYIGGLISFIIGVLIILLLNLITGSSSFNFDNFQNVMVMLVISMILIFVGTALILVVNILQIVYIFLTAKFLKKNYTEY
ncbi:MAG: hypothetical protein IKH94_04600 [Eubacterium sp.]|nr:hypothetical protein [Eubacterium sp.]